MWVRMQSATKFVCTALLSGLAVACATLTAYMTSIWWRGAREYPELTAPICGGAVASFVAIVLLATLHRRQRGRWAVIKVSLLLTAACFFAASVVFFTVLDNCRLSCGTKLRAESSSPKGNYRAMLVSETCAAPARYCPPIWHARVAGAIEQTVLSIDNGGGLELHWLAEDRLQIRYSPLAQILRQEERVGALHISYISFGIL